MGLRDAWRALFSRGVGPGYSSGEIAALMSTGQASPRSRQQLLQAIGETPALMAAQSRVSNEVSRLEWSFYLVPRSSGLGMDGVRQELASMSRDKPSQARAIRAMSLGDTPDLVPYSGPLTKFWRKPCPHLTAASWRWVISAQADLSGESVLWIRDRDARGVPLNMWPIPRHWIQSGTGSTMVQWPSGAMERVKDPAKDLLCYRRPHPANPFGLGLGVAESLNNELSTDEAASQLTYARYSNGGMPSWIVSAEGAEGSAKGGAATLSAQLKSRFSGPKKSGQIYVTSRKIEAKKLNDSIADLALDEQRKFFREVIWTTYGVPPEALGLVTSSNRATAQVAKDTLATGCTAPRAFAMRDFVQEEVVAQFDDPERILVVVENPIPEDWDYKLATFKAQAHAFSRDEWRSLAGQMPADGTDVYYVPAGLVAVPVDGSAAPVASGGGPKDPEDPDPDDDDEVEEVDDAEDARAALFLLPTSRQIDARINAVAASLEPERISKPMRGLWSRNLKWWITQEMTRLGVEISFDLINPMLLRHLENFAGDRITGINATTQKQITEALLAGVREGEDVRRLARRVQGVFDVSKSRAMTIARTEVIRSSNWGTTTAHRMSGLVGLRRWISTADSKTRDAHVALNGQVVGINAKFVVPSGEWTGREADHPCDFGIGALDIQCFPGDHTIEAPSGARLVFRRDYSGEVVKVVVDDGHDITGTPNHPVLTQRGWVALGSLDESDYVIRCGLKDSLRSPGHDVNDRPASFEEAFDLASIAGSTVGAGAGRTEDFHGDGGQGQIDIVAVESHLRDRLKPARLEHLKHLPFAPAGSLAGLLLADGSLAHLALGGGPAPVGGMGGLGQPHSLLPRGASHSDVHGAASAAYLRTTFDKPEPNDAAGYREALTERLLADAGLVEFKDQLGVEMSDLSRHRVVSIERSHRSMKVYNMETDSGWYICNGFVAHNCRCTTVAVIDPAKESIPGRAAKDDDAKTWQAYIDQVTPWETQAHRMVLQAFASQEQTALRELRKQFQSAAVAG